MNKSEQAFPLVVRVTEKKSEATDILSFRLEDPFGRELPPFAAGAHVNVRVESDLVRQYSLCNRPTDTQHYRIAVLREPESRGGSVAMHDRVHEGDLLQISAPQNHFELHQGASPPRLLFAGGIGITPILAMAHTLQTAGEPYTLFYGVRSHDRAAFLKEMATTGILSNTQLFTSDDGPDSDFAQRLPELVTEPETDQEVYICGPHGFIEAIKEAFEARGWEPDHLRSEYFEAAEVDTSNDGSFVVEVASSGERYIIPAHQTVLEVLDQAGEFIPSSCEQGVCGTCITPVLEGIPDHRDMFMEDEEHAANDQFTPCCSRALSDKLVIDL